MSLHAITSFRCRKLVRKNRDLHFRPQIFWVRTDQNNFADENFAPSFRRDSHLSFRKYRLFQNVISKRNHRSFQKVSTDFEKTVFAGIHFEVIILCHFEEINIIIWKYHFEFVVIYHFKRTARHNTPLGLHSIGALPCFSFIVIYTRAYYALSAAPQNVFFGAFLFSFR